MRFFTPITLKFLIREISRSLIRLIKFHADRFFSRLIFERKVRLCDDNGCFTARICYRLEQSDILGSLCIYNGDGVLIRSRWRFHLIKRLFRLHPTHLDYFDIIVSQRTHPVILTNGDLF